MQRNGDGVSSIRFGRFEMNLKSEELLRDGSAVKLPHQPFKVLLVLVENAGELVTREEIQRKVWGEDTVVDYDKGLNFCIKQIREALGDNAQSPQFVETLPRRGYRFIAHIENIPVNNRTNGLTEVGQADSSATGIVHEDRARSSRVAVKWLLVVSLLGLGAMLLYGVWVRRPPNASRPSGKNMLAVLPFENLNGESEQDYFSDGLTEEMISQLGRLQPQQLGVIARTTALTYKKSVKDIRQIGEELGVDYVLEGSVRREGERVRITTQLIQVRDQTHLWSETFDRDVGDMLQIQSEVAGQVARALALELLSTGTAIKGPGQPSNPAAVDAYLKGKFLVTKDTLPDLERSIPYFDQATEQDPNFAPAFAAAVEARLLLATWINIPAGEMQEKAKSDALRAIELDPSLAEAYAALGAVQFWFEWDWQTAGENISRALALNPSNPNTQILYADYLMSQGKSEEAATHIKLAIDLDPVSLLTNGLSAYCYLRLRRYDEAIVQAKRMLELEPKSPAAHDCLIVAYRAKGMYQEMRNLILKRMIDSSAKEGDIDEVRQGDAKQIADRLEHRQFARIVAAAAKGEKPTSLWLARLAARVGEKEKALLWLQQAHEERLPGIVFLAIHPDFDLLRDDPRFASLQLQMGFKR